MQCLFTFTHSPPITRSIACSKCFCVMASERCRAAIKAASLHTLAMSAPTNSETINIVYLSLYLIGLTIICAPQCLRFLTWKTRCEGSHVPGQTLLVQFRVQLQWSEMNFKYRRSAFNIWRTCMWWENKKRGGWIIDLFFYFFISNHIKNKFKKNFYNTHHKIHRWECEKNYLHSGYIKTSYCPHRGWQVSLNDF